MNRVTFSSERYDGIYAVKEFDSYEEASNYAENCAERRIGRGWEASILQDSSDFKGGVKFHSPSESYCITMTWELQDE